MCNEWKDNIQCWVRAVGLWVRTLAVWHSCARCSPSPASLSSCSASASCPLSPGSLHHIHAPSSQTSAATHGALIGSDSVHHIEFTNTNTYYFYKLILFQVNHLYSHTLTHTFSHFLCLLFPLFDLIFIDQPAERMTHVSNLSVYMNLKGKLFWANTWFSTNISLSLCFHKVVCSTDSFMCHSVLGKVQHSHPDNVLHVKILQWCDIGVVTFVIL